MSVEIDDESNIKTNWVLPPSFKSEGKKYDCTVKTFIIHTSLHPLLRSWP